MLLWSRLRGRRLEGFKFRRQIWIGPFIVDFLCKEAALAIEIDGSQHAETEDHDARRTGYLNDQGYRVIRFWNNDVLRDPEAVLVAIRAELLAEIDAAN